MLLPFWSQKLFTAKCAPSATARWFFLSGREKQGEPVDPHAGIQFHARRSARIEKGQPIATLYATSPALLTEPVALLK